MHDLIRRSIECFLRDTYGEEFWLQTAEGAGLSPSTFDIVFDATDVQMRSLIDSAAQIQEKPVDVLLEDMGTYLVSHGNSQRVRRLLRFSGETFEDFIHSLDDLPDRVRLVADDLRLPALDLWEITPGHYRLDVAPGIDGYPHVLLGALRSMADDYGALVFLELTESSPADPAHIQIALLDSAFAEGRDFDLSAMIEPKADTAEAQS